VEVRLKPDFQAGGFVAARHLFSAPARGSAERHWKRKQLDGGRRSRKTGPFAPRGNLRGAVFDSYLKSCGGVLESICVNRSVAACRG